MLYGPFDASAHTFTKNVNIVYINEGFLEVFSITVKIYFNIRTFNFKSFNVVDLELWIHQIGRQSCKAKVILESLITCQIYSNR